MSDEMREARSGRSDETIDRAVREMLDVEPPADLRARVIAEIDRPAAPRVGWKWILAPVAAAAIVILSVVLWLPSQHAGVVPVQSAHSEPAPLPPVSAHPAAAPPTHETSVRTVARVEPARTGRSSSIRTATAANSGAPVTEVAPLDPIAPIRVAAVTQSDITPMPVVVEPLAPIAEVRIAPLTPPDGRQ